MRQRNSKRTIQEIIDSDDEIITSDYVESLYVPAYKDDTRFEYLTKMKKEDYNIEEIPKVITSNTTKYVQKAVFNKKDILCLQYVQHTTPTNTFLWFFDFLLQKDSHSNQKFLISCLVGKYENDLKTVPMLKSSSDKLNVRYKLVVKE